jgi:hypothetical protein
MRKLIPLLLIPLLLAGALAPAAAHEGDTLGPYMLTYGWFDEPPVAGRPNTITLSIQPESAGSNLPIPSLEGVTAAVQTGDQSLSLSLTPDRTLAGLYSAPFTPPRPGTYSLILSGELRTPTDTLPVALTLPLDPVLSPTAARLGAALGPRWGLILAGGGGALLAALAGLLVWRLRRARRN